MSARNRDPNLTRIGRLPLWQPHYSDATGFWYLRRRTIFHAGAVVLPQGSVTWDGFNLPMRLESTARIMADILNERFNADLPGH